MGLKVGEVRLEDWSPQWQKNFEIEKDNLSKIFGDIALDIQHIGSTSIMGLKAKPIIDIAISVNKLSDFEKVIGKIEKLTEYSIKLDNVPDEILIRKGPENDRTHFIHITEQNDERMKDFLRFRDILRANPEIKRDYQKLKEELANKYSHNRKAYTIAKHDFIESTLLKY